MASRFRKAPEVREVARELIEEKHQHLMGVPMIYIFIEDTPVKKGKENWGTLSLLSGKTALYAQKAMDISISQEQEDGLPSDYHTWQDPSEWSCFELQISFSIWKVLDADWKRWLVNHELSHAGIDDNGKRKQLITIPHDIELFYTDSEQITGHEPKAFREQFRTLELAAFRTSDKQDDGQTVLFDGDKDGKETKQKRGGLRTLTLSAGGLDSKDAALARKFGLGDGRAA